VTREETRFTRWEVTMRYGVAMFQTDDAMRPDDLARAVEERGFESLVFVEHTHIPASRKTPYPVGGDLPPQYWHTHDVFVALAMAASVTKRLKLVTGVCLVVEHDPITLAKTVATLDHLSGGRVVLGVGGGWNAEEMENHGTGFHTRWKVLRERVEAMKQIWTNEEAEYHGEYVDFDKIWQHPKPAQKPHPPVLLGGGGRKTIERVVRYCDGWMPLTWLGEPIVERMGEMRALAEEKGRDPRSLSVSVFGAATDGAVIDGYERAGVERAIFFVPHGPADAVLPMLDDYAKFAAARA
jgi:probable F420-dependent oxidoreductase